MRVIINEKFGSPEVLQLEELEKPVPKNKEVLIKIHATTVTSGDIRLRNGNKEFLPFWPITKLFMGIWKPRFKTLGFEFSGVVEAVGEKVSKFKVGDEVFGSPGIGTYMDYKCVSENSRIALKPQNMSHQEAAAVLFGGETALFFLKKGNIKRGDKVLIVGASGSQGVFAVQLAKHFGAEVTAVCSTTNVELVKSLGADKVIDYTQEDFSQNGEKYDIIYETVDKTPLAKCLNSLKPKGYCLLAVIDYHHILPMLKAAIFGGKKIISGSPPAKIKNLLDLKEFIERGTLKTVIDRSYPLEEIVEAHRYVEKGHKKGHVVIDLTILQESI